jgi:hypothetical protein
MQPGVRNASGKRRLASNTLQLLPVFLASVLFAGLALGVHGQSGRKIPKQPNRDTPSPTKPDEPPAAEQQPKQDSRIPVLISRDDQPLNDVLTSIVLDGIMDRLKESASINAQTSMRGYNRKEASDAAKGSEYTVLWWEFRLDSVGGPPPVGRTQREIERLYINFAVYSPGTGKLKTSGNVYQRPYNAIGGVPRGIPTPTAGVAEYSLRQAGSDTADRLMSTLGVKTLPRIPRTTAGS